jgi:hypothetical protein
MPVIRISQQTWDRLKTYATPLEDTADDVVNIALDALEAARRKGLRLARRSTAASLPKKKPERPKRAERAALKIFKRLFWKHCIGWVARHTVARFANLSNV